MTTLLQRGLALLASALPEQAGESVTYRRGDDAIAWTAAIGRTDAPLVIEGMLVTEHTEADFIGPAATLAIDGTRIEPRAGDRIEWSDGDTVYTYVIAPYFAGEKHFRYMGPGHAMVRVHGALVGTTAS